MAYSLEIKQSVEKGAIETYNSLPAYNESCEGNSTKYLNSQFNPFVVENMAPVLLKLTAYVEGIASSHGGG